MPTLKWQKTEHRLVLVLSYEGACCPHSHPLGLNLVNPRVKAAKMNSLTLHTHDCLLGWLNELPSSCCRNLFPRFDEAPVQESILIDGEAEVDARDISAQMGQCWLTNPPHPHPYGIHGFVRLFRIIPALPAKQIHRNTCIIYCYIYWFIKPVIGLLITNS